MKLKVWLNQAETQVSSIQAPDFRTVRHGHSTGKRPVRSVKVFNVIACEEHNELTPTVVAPAVKFEEGNYDGIPCGRARICFMCWNLIELLKE
jgi:hypothetical protein